MRFAAGDLTININCRKGLYAFYDDSATGKSYLVKVLKSLAITNAEEICVITYNEMMTEEACISRLLNKQYAVVVLDRLDLYLTEHIEECISRIREECVVLVDLKNWNKFRKICPNLCDIEFDLKGFEIYECNDV